MTGTRRQASVTGKVADAAALDVLALEAAQAGGWAIAAVLDGRTLGIAYKDADGHDPVTAADHASERAIRRLIQERRPRDAWLAEESAPAAGSSGVRWVVDPLDGTVNVCHGSARYAVSVAAEAGQWDRILAAAIVQPSTGDWLALRSTGMLHGSRAAAITGTGLGHALVSFAVPGAPGPRRATYRLLAELAPKVQDLRNYGSSVCDLFAVATGDVDGFVSVNPAPWDIAAGAAIVRAAGGLVRRWRRADGLEIIVAGGAEVAGQMCRWLSD
jgi:myo-inositol-1(or 4)-monophosphatase